MSDFNYIHSLFNDGQPRDPKRRCRIIRAADLKEFWKVQFEDGTTASVHSTTLTKVKTSDEPKPNITIEPATGN